MKISRIIFVRDRNDENVIGFKLFISDKISITVSSESLKIHDFRVSSKLSWSDVENIEVLMKDYLRILYKTILDIKSKLEKEIDETTDSKMLKLYSIEETSEEGLIFTFLIKSSRLTVSVGESTIKFTENSLKAFSISFESSVDVEQLFKEIKAYKCIAVKELSDVLRKLKEKIY